MRERSGCICAEKFPQFRLLRKFFKHMKHNNFYKHSLLYNTAAPSQLLFNLASAILFLLIALFLLPSQLNACNPTVSFENIGCEKVSVYWNKGQSDQYYTTIDPGDSLKVRTNLGDIWYFSGWYGSSQTWVVNSCDDQTYQVKTKDKVEITNNGSCKISLFCEEWSADGQTNFMGVLSTGERLSIFPSAETAYIYAKNEDGEEINGIWTDGSEACYTINFSNCIANKGGLPPVKLIAFQARQLDAGKIMINWMTGSEIDNDYFIVERSTDAKLWNRIDLIPGAGNTTVRQVYESVDARPVQGLNYYRLKQVDYDGNSKYSAIKRVHYKGAIASNY